MDRMSMKLLFMGAQLTEDEVMYGYVHKDPTVDGLLAILVNNILYTKPSPSYYASFWKNNITDSHGISDDERTNALCYFDKVPDIGSIKAILWNKIEPELFITQIYRAISTFYPLILIENAKYTDLETEYQICIEDPYTLNVHLKECIVKYYKDIEYNDVSSILIRYTNSIKFDHKNNEPVHTFISRAQYAITVMILSGLNEADRIIVLNKLKLLVAGITSKKPTKVLTHILCCIIYSLFKKHAKISRQTLNGYCRERTADVVNLLSPKNEYNEPLSIVDRRSVEVALTGK